MRSNKGSVLILLLRGPLQTTSAIGDKLSGVGYIFSILERTSKIQSI
jgi:hypothetical protein